MSNTRNLKVEDAVSNNHMEYLNTAYNTRANRLPPHDPHSVKHGFILAFYFLHQAQNKNDLSQFYDDAIRQTIMSGGDTAANCAIVGGLIGCLVGVKKLPMKMLSSLFSFDCTNP